MAVTKIKPIRGTVNKALAYIQMCIRDSMRSVTTGCTVRLQKNMACRSLCCMIWPVSYTHLDVYKRQVWGIPEDAEKPADARIKNGKYIKKPAENEK